MKVKTHTYTKALELAKQKYIGLNISDSALLDHLPSSVFGRTLEVVEYSNVSDSYKVSLVGTTWEVDPLFVKEVIRI